MYNSEIVKVYKDTKSIVQKYENKLKRHNLSLEDSQDATVSDDSTEVCKKQPAIKERRSSKATAAGTGTGAGAGDAKYEANPKLVGNSNDKAGSIVLKRKPRAKSASSDSSYEGDSKKKATGANGTTNQKKRDAIIRGEQIDGAATKKRGRPRMTSSEKEVAREKRRLELKNAPHYDEKMEDSRIESRKQATSNTKRKYVKRSQRGETPVYQVVVNDKGNAIGKKD